MMRQRLERFSGTFRPEERLANVSAVEPIITDRWEYPAQPGPWATAVRTMMHTSGRWDELADLWGHRGTIDDAEARGLSWRRRAR